jgi:hypothetical protein
MEQSNEDWNPMDWQGRSKRQVETSNKLAMISLIGLIVILAISAIIS